MKLHHNSLFAVLLRSPWWISVALAAGIFGATRLFLPTEFALFAAAPFIVIALYVMWKALRAPSAARTAKKLDRLHAMSWDEFSAAIEEAFRRDGYTVKRLAGSADFELAQGSRSTLLACKRWKAMRTGIEPLRELEKARRSMMVNGSAAECIYVATGEVTAQARAFAAERNIRLVEGAELVALTQIGVGPRKAEPTKIGV
jgi:restriction system protein